MHVRGRFGADGNQADIAASATASPNILIAVSASCSVMTKGGAHRTVWRIPAGKSSIPRFKHAWDTRPAIPSAANH
jgi:hypothetical protein